jgi:hypothetical protein
MKGINHNPESIVLNRSASLQGCIGCELAINTHACLNFYNTGVRELVPVHT